MAQQYYANKHNEQLITFMRETMEPEVFLHWCHLTALKYHVRAGKKEYESRAKDTDKRNDYIAEIVRHPLNKVEPVNYAEMAEIVIRSLDVQKEEFENWQSSEK